MTHDALAVAHVRDDGTFMGWFADCECSFRRGLFAVEAAAKTIADDHNALARSRR